MNKKQKKLQKKRKKAFYKAIAPFVASTKKILLTDIPIKKVPLLFKLDAVVIKSIRGILLLIIGIIQGILKTKKRVLTFGKIRKGTLKGLNLAGSGYQLFNKAEPFVKSQLSKSKEKKKKS